MITIQTRAVRAAALIAGAAALVFPLAVRSAADYDVSLPGGTVIPVTLDKQLGSDSSHKGEKFTATVKTGENATYSGLPEGTQVEGHVTLAEPKQGDDPGVLDLAFDAIRMPDGSSHALAGSLYALDSKSVKRDEDGRLVATSSGKKNKMTYVGYGAGAGLLLALLSDHSTSKALQDIILGAGLGYLAGSLDKSDRKPHDVNLKAGTEFGVRVEKTFALNSSAPRPDHHSTGGSPTATVTPAVYEHSGTAPAVMIDDQLVEFSSAEPVVKGGVMLVPAAEVLRAAGVPFAFTARERGIVARGSAGRAELKLGSRIVMLEGGRRIRLDAPAQRISGELYVPLRFLEVATDKKVHWDAATKTAILEDAALPSDDRQS